MIKSDGSQEIKHQGGLYSLFIFLRDDPEQNGVKLLTPVYDLVFNALSDGTKHFALYGS